MIGEYLTKANAQYNDYTGTVAGDLNYPLISLEDYISEFGFDTSKYYPFSIQLNFGEPFNDGTRTTTLIILAVSIEDIGGNKEDIVSHANSNNKEVPTYRFTHKVDPQQFFGKFKRFNINLGYQSKCGHEHVDTIVENIISETCLDD